LASSTPFLKFGLATWPSTGAAAAAGNSWTLSTPHLRCLATGLSIALAGLVGDDMVDEKMNFVVGATM
jgi:hypothetical protein